MQLATMMFVCIVLHSFFRDKGRCQMSAGSIKSPNGKTHTIAIRDGLHLTTPRRVHPRNYCDVVLIRLHICGLLRHVVACGPWKHLQPVQTPLEFMLRGEWYGEKIGLRYLDDEYHIKLLTMETLGTLWAWLFICGFNKQCAKVRTHNLI